MIFKRCDEKVHNFRYVLNLEGIKKKFVIFCKYQFISSAKLTALHQLLTDLGIQTNKQIYLLMAILITKIIYT